MSASTAAAPGTPVRFQAILYLKAAAIVGVVFHHVLNPRLQPETLAWLGDLRAFFCWCVLAFFFASGYLHASSEGRHARSFLVFVRLRALRILVPFVLLVIAYALVWQGIQSSGVIRLNGTVPPGFWEKITNSLWPVNRNVVAEQLYYLPLLFAISVVTQLFLSLLRKRGIFVLAGLAVLAGIVFYPAAEYTGFSAGVFVWGIALYCMGFLLFPWRMRTGVIAAAAFTLLLVVLAGPSNAARAVPIWLMALAVGLPRDPGGVLEKVGTASGTIYIYHTPFLMQFALIVISALHDARLQFAGAFAASFAIVGVLTFFHLKAQDTPLRRVLL